MELLVKDIIKPYKYTVDEANVNQPPENIISLSISAHRDATWNRPGQPRVHVLADIWIRVSQRVHVWEVGDGHMVEDIQDRNPRFYLYDMERVFQDKESVVEDIIRRMNEDGLIIQPLAERHIKLVLPKYLVEGAKKTMSYGDLEVQLHIEKIEIRPPNWMNIINVDQDPIASSLLVGVSLGLIEPFRFDVCAICLSELPTKETKMLPCHHAFHVACISQWISKKYNCPMCRRSILALQ